MNLRNFLISVVFLSSLVACETWKPRDYGLAFKYHPKIGGGTSFGVLSHNFKELSEKEMEDLLKTSAILPAATWEMMAVDLIKACRMLGKKCDSEVAIINGMFTELKLLNKKLDQGETK